MKGRHFKVKTDEQGRRFIVAPNGRRVIEYWNCSFGRLGNLREFNAEFIDGRPIICRHGGALRTLLKYLNTGKWLYDYDEHDLYAGAETRSMLDALREAEQGDDDN